MLSNDLHLARRLVQGDERAFDAFFSEYFPRLYRFARVRLGGDENAAEEVVQAALIRAVAKVHTYRGEAALFTWLCTFCRHEIAAWCERTGRAVTLSLADESSGARTLLDAIAMLAQDGPERQLERQELSRLVHSALDHLPGHYGSALEWKYMDGVSVDEIGRRLDLSYKAAESLLTGVLLAFREAFLALSEHGWDGESMPGTPELP
ncbi:MAG: sigma-70 family RNA polymerase sigma factor [Acidobacteriota bacterium]